MNIDIELKNDSDALNKFNQNKISESLNNYLIQYLEYKPLKEQITLTIKGDNNSKLEKVIKDYYKEKYYFLKKVDTLDTYIRLVLFVIGIIFIVVSEQFISVLSEIFLIAGWLIIWEVVYDILFTELKRKRKAKIYKYLATCKIIFQK